MPWSFRKTPIWRVNLVNWIIVCEISTEDFKLELTSLLLQECSLLTFDLTSRSAAFPIALPSPTRWLQWQWSKNTQIPSWFFWFSYRFHAALARHYNYGSARFRGPWFVVCASVFRAYPSYFTLILNCWRNLSNARYVLIFAPLSVMSNINAISLKSLSSKNRSSNTCTISVGSSFM